MSEGRVLGRREFLKGAAGLAALAALGQTASAAPTKKPNFIIINCDDLGYGDLGCYGNELIKTPNLDRMAGEGVRFTDFYSAAAVCTPSRAGLNTGRYPIRSGLTYVLSPGNDVGISDYEVTIAQALKQQGYATAIMGKWHLGHLPQFLPTRHGFDYYYGIPYSNDMHPMKDGYTDTPLYRNEEVVERPAKQDLLTERYTQETIDFMRKHRDQPFFVYLAHTMPHVPLYVSERFKGRSKRGLYGDVVECIDWGVGQILEAIKELGIEKDTLVMFTSDNGPWLIKGEHGGSAGPLRAGKGWMYEGGMREPMIARWPGRIKPGRTCREPASNLDYLPTLASLAGGKAPTDRIIDGRDISGLLLQGGRMPDHPFFFMGRTKVNAVRRGNWKLHVGPGNELAQPELYNLRLDIGEKRNVATQYPEIVNKLHGIIGDFKKTLPVAVD